MKYAPEVDIEAVKARVAERAAKAAVTPLVRGARELIAARPTEARAALGLLVAASDAAGVTFTAAEANLIVALRLDKPGED